MAKTFTHIFLQALSYFFFNSHIITYFSGHSQKKTKHTVFSQSSHMYTKISKKASKKLPSFSCPNPDCPVGYRSFDTVKGYQNHLTHSAVCTEYASRQLSLVQSLACQPTSETVVLWGRNNYFTRHLLSCPERRDVTTIFQEKINICLYM